MPVNPDHAILPSATLLLERSFALADEAATHAFGAALRRRRSKACAKRGTKHAPHANKRHGIPRAASPTHRRPRRRQNHPRARDLARPRSHRPRAQSHLHARRTLCARAPCWGTRAVSLRSVQIHRSGRMGRRGLSRVLRQRCYLPCRMAAARGVPSGGAGSRLLTRSGQRERRHACSSHGHTANQERHVSKDVDQTVPLDRIGGYRNA